MVSEMKREGFEMGIRAKKNLTGKKIIWQYWGSGYAGVPALVEMCLKSVEKHCPADEYLIIRLSDENIGDYIEFPEAVKKNRHLYSDTHFSDMLRCCLLYLYGGCWLDATILLTGRIPAEIESGELFMYQRTEHEKDRKYWENAFAFYYGWSENFKVRILTSIMCARQGTGRLLEITTSLLYFFSKGYRLPDYFFNQLLWYHIENGDFRHALTPVISDCIPHYMQQYINDPQFNLCTLEQILARTSIHKLTYKSAGADMKLRQILDTLP